LACKPKPYQIFPRRFRLTRRDGFSRILKQRSHSNLWFAIHSQPNKEGCARLGITISKRVVPTAAQRNSIKRLVRECFRHQNRQGIERDVVIRLRKPLCKQERVDAKAALFQTLSMALASK
jgi:ribonuclease P protein component